ncbi:hypothetical protein C6500_09770 [Candidatus Poribacteria bacterium]|nr:MAG: hypothetical protein C6500_09770 [Candidatus Poribacteria bacterium]
MKLFIPLLILMSVLITEAVAQGPPTNVRATPGDRQIRLTWEPPSDTGGFSVEGYNYRNLDFHDGGGVPGGASARSFTITTLPPTSLGAPRPPLQNGTSYRVRVSVVYPGGVERHSPDIDVTPMIPAPTGFTVTFDEPTTGDRTATLRWTAPSPLAAAITGYEYSQNGGPWIPTGSTTTSHSVTGLENGVEYSFRVRAVRDGASDEPNGLAAQIGDVTPEAPEAPRKRRRIILDCPVGWVRSDGFAGRTRRVLIYEVNVEMDLHNRVSIYKPVWVAIYVHPDEGLENLDGWKLQVALPYNHHREYPLTAENSVVVEANFVEGGFAFIENPEENPFPMTGVGFTGSPAPGFDYRLYDETGKRVDFGISCYKRFDIFQVLKDAEDPRVLRKVLLESFDWDTHYLRSEWTVPVPVNGFPGAPSLQRVNLVGKWADLKKQ